MGLGNIKLDLWTLYVDKLAKCNSTGNISTRDITLYMNVGECCNRFDVQRICLNEIEINTFSRKIYIVPHLVPMPSKDVTTRNPLLKV